MKPYLTTGEAAKILGISRSTISRKFDQNVLEGKKNPITGERLISRKSVEALLQHYDIRPYGGEEAEKTVLMATTDDHLEYMVQEVLVHGEHITVERVSFGTDVMVRCLSQHIDLLIIDQDLPDISGTEVVKSLRRRGDLNLLKVLCRMSVRDDTLCREMGADVCILKGAKEEKQLPDIMLTLLGISEKPDLKTGAAEAERRVWPRVPVYLPAGIELYRTRAPQERDRGTGVLRNLSIGGAYLSDIQLESGAIPCESFRFALVVNQGSLDNWSADCKVIRLQSNGSITAGLEFLSMSKADRKKVAALVEVPQYAEEQTQKPRI